MCGGIVNKSWDTTSQMAARRFLFFYFYFSPLSHRIFFSQTHLSHGKQIFTWARLILPVDALWSTRFIKRPYLEFIKRPYIILVVNHVPCSEGVMLDFRSPYLDVAQRRGALSQNQVAHALRHKVRVTCVTSGYKLATIWKHTKKKNR